MGVIFDQLIIGKTASLDDFDASVKERRIYAPKKKSIKETVPFSNVTYDFSAINGEVYWEERELEYVFEIIADNPEQLERKKTRFTNWIMNVMNEEIHDPYDPDWHYVGTFESLDPVDDESMEKTTITVLFMAYPYNIANALTVYTIKIPAASSVEKTIKNDSSHRITPTLYASAEMTLEIGNASYTIPAGEVHDDSLTFDAGSTVITVRNQGCASCTLNIVFLEEVF